MRQAERSSNLVTARCPLSKGTWSSHFHDRRSRSTSVAGILDRPRRPPVAAAPAHRIAKASYRVGRNPPPNSKKSRTLLRPAMARTIFAPA
jgi:hypothetical protein